MKALFTGLLLVLSLSAISAENKVPCLDAKGNVVDENSMNNQKGGRTQVFVTGTITQIDKEDHNGLPHQKYNIKIGNNTTYLIVSNLEFGRVPLVIGKKVSVCGEYKKVGSGMVHWTHFDPHGSHANGFTIMDGVLYGDKEEALINNY